MATYIADITLIEDSTAGNPPRVCRAQRVQIEAESDTLVQSVDGFLSSAQHPSTIRWLGGEVKDLEHITNVKIVASDSGVALIDGAVNRNFAQPRMVDGCVEFKVL